MSDFWRPSEANPNAGRSSLSLWKMLGASPGALLLSVIAGLAAGGGTAGLLTFISGALERYEPSASGPATAFFGLCIAALAAGALSEVLLLRLTQRNLLELRFWLSRRILAAPLQQLQSCGPHRLMAALTEDMESIAHAHEMLPLLCIEGAVVLGGLIYIGWLSWFLLLVVLAFLLAGVIGFHIPQNAALRWLKRARDADDALFGHFRAMTDGCKELKMDARRRHAFLHEELGATADRIRSLNSTGSVYYILAAQWGKLAFFLAIGFVLYVAPHIDLASRQAATGCTLAILFIMTPISTVVNAVPALGRGLIALRKIEALGGAMPEEKALADLDPAAIPPVPETPGLLELDRVTHRYGAEGDERGFVLGPLDLRIEPGELVFLTGGNGGGKTTLAMLLLGLYFPETGEIRLNGAAITDVNRDGYRQHFAAVFADAFVFDRLLGYSGRRSAEQADQLLARLQLDAKVKITEGRFSSVDLSRGQRKRLALLAAYLEDRPFYLFDEWAAEQDPLFREIFYKEMLPKLKARGKTVIVITHDDRYFPLADRLLHLTMGQLAEPSALVAASAAG
ncbi:cyclic peptide export ABC transporter [Methylocapsa aurea]|uniref:cyclic peptide export ABC transporter n=1 Tax=Methylocapsa aurea TaxID=663610 RepID=UPI00192E6277|nr:cyclic peptide export ABC transporter [Methylocapsa aurea]